jgi:hypothetical protein
VAYAFDPERNAVLLLGGDKTGDDRFYEWLIPSAERSGPSIWLSATQRSEVAHDAASMEGHQKG